MWRSLRRQSWFRPLLALLGVILAFTLVDCEQRRVIEEAEQMQRLSYRLRETRTRMEGGGIEVWSRMPR